MFRLFLDQFWVHQHQEYLSIYRIHAKDFSFSFLVSHLASLDFFVSFFVRIPKHFCKYLNAIDNLIYLIIDISSIAIVWVCNGLISFTVMESVIVRILSMRSVWAKKGYFLSKISSLFFLGNVPNVQQSPQCATLFCGIYVVHIGCNRCNI